MNLSNAPSAYDANDENKTRSAIQAEDKRNVKRDEVLDRFYMKDTATGARVMVVVTSGAFVIS